MFFFSSLYILRDMLELLCVSQKGSEKYRKFQDLMFTALVSSGVIIMKYYGLEEKKSESK